MQNNLVICSDDFGLGRGVNEAILNLANQKKIQAVSVIIDSFDKFNDDFLKLKSLSEKIEIGLHVNLESIIKLEAIDLFFGVYNKKECIKNEISRQLAMFLIIFECSPSFIDSHKHIHMHPFVNNILIEFLNNYKFKNLLYVRNTYSNNFFSYYSYRSLIKKIVLDVLGFIAKNKYRKYQIKTNDSFRGVLSYHSDNFTKLFFEDQSSEPRGLCLFYTHPASHVEDLKNGVDNYLHGRIDEYRVLLNQNN